MLRLLVIALLLANLGYYAWSQGLLREWGVGPQEQAEPERMQQQIRPETLQILRNRQGKGPAAPMPAPVSAQASADTTECLQAGVFDDRQAEALRTAAAPLPEGSWSLESTPVPGRWMIYMGRFADQDALEKKKAELRARKVAFDRPSPALEPGLSLGRFASEDAAQRELINLGNQGVRTARVVVERAESTGFTLRLPAVNDTLRGQLDVLRTAMAGKTLRNCG